MKPMGRGLQLRYNDWLAKQIRNENLSKASQNDLAISRTTAEDAMRRYRVEADKAGKSIADIGSQMQINNLLAAARECGTQPQVKRFVQIARTQRKDFGRPEWR